jgi:hypothetical protein
MKILLGDLYTKLDVETVFNLAFGNQSYVQRDESNG